MTHHILKKWGLGQANLEWTQKQTPIEGSATEPAAAAPLANALVPPMGKKALSGPDSGTGVALKTTDGADTSSRGA